MNVMYVYAVSVPCMYVYPVYVACIKCYNMINIVVKGDHYLNHHYCTVINKDIANHYHDLQ